MAGRLADGRSAQHKASLRDTMIALGFRRNHGIQRRFSGHSAGMDAVRAVAILVALLSRKPTDGHVVIHRFTKEEHNNRVLWEKLPRPAAKFPHTVKVVSAGRVPLPPSLSRTQRLFNFVTATFDDPKAVAVCPAGKPQKSHAWVSFHDEAALRHFVKECDGKIVDGVLLLVGERPPPEVMPKNRHNPDSQVNHSPPPAAGDGEVGKQTSKSSLEANGSSSQP